MRIPLFITILVTLFFSSGCRDSAFPDPDPSGDEVFELMSGLSLGDIDEAYTRLDGFAYTTEVVVEELDVNDQVVASASRTVRRIPTADGVEEAVLNADSLGLLSGRQSFEGLLRPANPLSNILPDEPAYVRMRARDRYAYEMRADTTVNNQRLRVAQATLHQESADEQPIRYARYYLDDANTIVGAVILRLTRSALFDETSHVKVWLLPDPNGVYLPRRAESETIIHTPGNNRMRLRLTHTVRDIVTVE